MLLITALIVLYFAALSDGHLNKFNLKFDCAHEGTAICCAALEPKNFSSSEISKIRGVGNGYGEQFISSHHVTKQIHKLMDHHNCEIHREYVPSRYEINHIAKVSKRIKYIHQAFNSAFFVIYTRRKNCSLLRIDLNGRTNS